jgi:hypothetical protein
MAVRAYAEVRSGERCAEVISISKGTPNFFSMRAVSVMMGKSVSLPMTIPTNGFSDMQVLLHLLTS